MRKNKLINLCYQKHIIAVIVIVKWNLLKGPGFFVQG